MGGTDEGPPWELCGDILFGDEPILGQGNSFWTKANLSYAMATMDMIGGWTNEGNDDGAYIVGSSPGSLLLSPYISGGHRWRGSP